MDEDRNLFEKVNFQGQALCSEITGSHGGFFQIGTPAFCSESIGFLENNVTCCDFAKMLKYSTRNSIFEIPTDPSIT